MFSLVGQNLDVHRTRLKAKTILGLVQVKTLKKFCNTLEDAATTAAPLNPSSGSKRKAGPETKPAKRINLQHNPPTQPSSSPEEIAENILDNVHYL